MTELPVRRLYGLRIASAFPFTHHLPAEPGPTDLEFEVEETPEEQWVDLEPGAHTVAWESPERTAGGAPQTRLLRSDRGETLSFPGISDFHLAPHRIVAAPSPAAAPGLLELRFLGPVLGYHLERAGTPVLHASALVVGGRAVALLAGHHGGKSTLAAALMRRGHALLSDDLLPLRNAGSGYLAQPGYPQMRFWPGDAERVTGRRGWPPVASGVPKVRVAVGTTGERGDATFGRFCAGPVPLAAVLVLRRGDESSPVALRPVPPAAAAMHLVQGSFLPRLVTGAGLQPARLDFFADLVERVPVRELLYPTSHRALGEVVEALESM
jgi:hypothetical protein